MKRTIAPPRPRLPKSVQVLRIEHKFGVHALGAEPSCPLCQQFSAVRDPSRGEPSPTSLNGVMTEEELSAAVRTGAMHALRERPQ